MDSLNKMAMCSWTAVCSMSTWLEHSVFQQIYQHDDRQDESQKSDWLETNTEQQRGGEIQLTAYKGSVKG